MVSDLRETDLFYEVTMENPFPQMGNALNSAKSKMLTEPAGESVWRQLHVTQCIRLEAGDFAAV